jgi:hypothetical protein
MKTDTTTTVLNFALVLLAISGVIFAIMTFMRTHELGVMRSNAMRCENVMMRVQSLFGEVNAYNQNLKKPDPDLTRILQLGQGKPAAKP